ncbi:MAG: DUF4149 domain-containing protein [Rhodocyclaceae bacterium]
MRRISEALYAIAIALWVGGLWAIGYLAAPALFRALSDRALAGDLAGRLFALIAWVGIVCAVYLILFLITRKGWRAFACAPFWLVVAMLAMTLAGQFGIQPLLAQLKADAFPREVMESVLRSRFAVWHGVASVLYLVESVAGLALVVLQGRGLR